MGCPVSGEGGLEPSGLRALVDMMSKVHDGMGEVMLAAVTWRKVVCPNLQSSLCGVFTQQFTV